ncbi:unnamed protein product [Onchocerca ochengi]|uniref:ATP-dependent DNA helicase n=1 Tax=Onchocerca ochengi TaxID=42157 RepID=A0A182E3W9_ONCOC|nr:unnamed protein product [Onchocerca ochengi]
MVTYRSFDTVMEAEEAINYPTEFLNSLDLPWMPQLVLQLKIGMPIIMLRNINQPKLYNGTRLAVKKLMSDLVRTFERYSWFQRTSNMPKNSNCKFSADNLSRQWDGNSRKIDVGATDMNDKSTRKQICCLAIPKLKFLNRQCNETLVKKDTKQRRSSVAWRNTVALARRKTRQKAFLMLTLNMIFWTPYCVMGILSTIMEIDHAGYDFLNALVVFNAVSNLLL